MRAGAMDLVIETSTTVRKAFSWFQPGLTSTPVGMLGAGSRFYFEGLPEKVYSVTPNDSPPGSYIYRFRHGLWWEPSVTLMPTDRVMPAVPVAILEAKAAWVDFEMIHPINTSISATADMVSIVMTETETATFEASLGTWPWDLYVRTAEYGWSRLIQGQMSIVLGDARASIPPYTYPIEVPMPWVAA